MDPSLLCFAHAIHIDLTPSDLYPLLIVITLEHSLEGTMPKLLVELRKVSRGRYGALFYMHRGAI